jgi:8-oxo-dGTP diphosphatase
MIYNCALTVDCVVFSKDSVVLIKRKNTPFQGYYALPGGFVEENENVELACIREAYEETNLVLKNLTFIGAYSAPGRDPRGRVVSFAFLAEADLNQLRAGDDASHVEIINNWQDIEIAFDHRKIIEAALKIKREHKQ